MPNTRGPQGKMDNIIEARELQIERKHFYVELRQNERGRFLRITKKLTAAVTASSCRAQALMTLQRR